MLVTLYQVVAVFYVWLCPAIIYMIIVQDVVSHTHSDIRPHY